MHHKPTLARLPSQRRVVVIFFVLTLVFLSGCRPQTTARHYPFNGEIIAVDRAAHQIIVRHQDIPNFMKAMTMPFAVKDAQTLDHLQIGQLIKATLAVTDTESWLENVQVTGQAPSEPAQPSSFHIPTEGTPVPDFVFTNQDGHRVHLSEYKGKAVLLTFIYTRCPLPDFCPRMTNNFLAIEKSLNQDPAVYGRTHLLTITFDPEVDTPKVLREHALSTTALPASELFSHWEFLSPQPKDLDAIAHFFALTVQKEQGQITHSLSTVVIDRDGKLYRWYHGNSWTPEEMLRETKAAAGGS
jgi:protein SCO1/2